MQQRRLSAILSADVVGYSALMEADEAGTLERLKENRSRIFDPCVAAHAGRIVKLMGDGALIEFASVVQAVHCALALQQQMAHAEADSRDTDRIRYRVGINIGDVIVEDDDIYGEGVNIATRLQELAPVGGIAVSHTVRDQIVGKVPCTFEDLGEHTIKTLQRPVRAYAVAPVSRTHGEGRRATAHRVAICVLPFANMSHDPEQEYFSDGISEDIITDLSKVSALWVAARNTSFAYKGKVVDVPQLARQLKVSHVLEGSVRKSGGRVRITAQLIDGASGGHIWAERYDRELKDIFALQDEISQAIVAALRLKLLPEEKQAIEQRGTTDPSAYNLYLMARQFSLVSNRSDERRSEAIIRLCRRATEIDPDYARPWALMAHEQAILRLYFGGDRDDGLAAAERAIALDANLADAHAVRATVMSQRGRLDEARQAMEIALRLDPDAYEVNFLAGRLCFVQSRFAEAIGYLERAIAILDTEYLAASGLVTCYRGIGDTENARRVAEIAVARIQKIVAAEPDNGSALGAGVLALAALGDVERANEWTERALLFNPDNLHLRYDLACSLVTLHEFERALDLLGPVLESKVTMQFVNWAKIDPDLVPLHEHPRFKAMIAAAEARRA